MMTALAVSPLIFWFAALVSRPRTPLPGNEVEEVVYSRLLGRQQLLTLLAFVVTAAAVVMMIVTLPQRIDPGLTAIRQANAACLDARHKASDALDSGASVNARCYELQPGGGWVVKMEQSDGNWRIIGAIVTPRCHDDYAAGLTFEDVSAAC